MLGVSDQVRTAAEAHGQASADVLLTALSGWSPRVLNKRFSDVLAGYSEPLKASVLATLSNERLTIAREAEATALAEQGSDLYRLYQQRLLSHPPGALRQQRIDELDQAMQFSQWVVAARRAVAIAQGRSFDEQQVRRETRGFLFYAYRYTDNERLTELAVLWRENAVQQWLNDAGAALPAPVISSDSAG